MDEKILEARKMITQEELGRQIEKAVELLDQGYLHAVFYTSPKQRNDLTEPIISSQAPSADIIPPELAKLAEEMSLDPEMLARAILLDWVKRQAK